MVQQKSAQEKSALEACAAIPATLGQPGAARFWAAIVVTGIGAGLSAALLTSLLLEIQSIAWSSRGADILAAAQHAPPLRRVLVLLAGGLLTGMGQLALTRLTTGNAIEITTALWFSAGRLPLVRTIGSAILSETIVAMGASLGREGAPKQVGAALADLLSDRADLSDEQRKLVVACGAGAGMAAVYDVPLGGALFALEVLRGALSLRLALPALTASCLATATAWIALPDRPLYHLGDVAASTSVMAWALLAGPVFGLAAVLFVRMIALADHIRPSGVKRLAAPALAFAALGSLSIFFPQLLGNGQDLAQLTFVGGVPTALVMGLLLLKPFATFICFASGAPGGLFTPSLTFGALAGSALGALWSTFWPGTPAGLFAIVGAGAVLAATTQGPVSAAILVIELTGRQRVFIVPMLLAIAGACVVARTIDIRSIYDARLSDQQLAARAAMRERTPTSA